MELCTCLVLTLVNFPYHMCMEIRHVKFSDCWILNSDPDRAFKMQTTYLILVKYFDGYSF